MTAATPAVAWTLATTVDIELADHTGRDSRAPLAVVVAINNAADADATYLSLDLPADAGWDDILDAATTAIRIAGCPEGPTTWAGAADTYLEDCGCSWVSREIAWPRPAPVGDTEITLALSLTP